MFQNWGFRPGARGVAVRGTASRAGRSPPLGPKASVHKTRGSRRAGRAGEPARGAPAASGSLADVPHRPRLPSCPPPGPTDRPRDLYGSFLWIIGISHTLTLSNCHQGSYFDKMHHALIRLREVI